MAKITVYCHFQFNSFPFDSHICNFSLGAVGADRNIVTLKPPIIFHEEHMTYFGYTPIVVDTEHSQIPFDVTLSSGKPFTHVQYRVNSSYSGMIMRLKRRDMGVLLGSYAHDVVNC